MANKGQGPLIGDLQVLISWECTIAHAIPWKTFNLWMQKDTDKSKFIAAISAASIAYEHKVRSVSAIPEPASVSHIPACIIANLTCLLRHAFLVQGPQTAINCILCK